MIRIKAEADHREQFSGVTSEQRAAPFAFLSRRRFLKLGLGAGTALLASGAGAWSWLRGGAPDVLGLSVLEPYEHRTLVAIVEVLFPPGSFDGVDVRALELPRLFDTFLEGEPAQNVSDLRDGLTFLELGPLLYERRAVRFSSLPQREREAHFVSWMTSDDLVRRKVARAFRSFFDLVLYDHETIWPFLGYPGPAMAAGPFGSAQDGR